MGQNKELDNRMLNAVAGGHLDLVRQLITEGADPQALHRDGRTGLHIAMNATSTYYGSTGRELTAIFLNRGVDVNAKDAQGATVLHYAVQETDYGASAKTTDMVAFGADIHARDNSGRTPLHWAAKRSYKTDASQYLIGRGARVNEADEQGVTPLHLAAARGDAEIIQFFLKAGADIHAVTREGKTVWDFAVDNGHDYQAQVLKAEAASRKKAEKQKLEQVREAAKPQDPWTLLSPDRVSFSAVEKTIGYKLTEIFNFSARTYTQITHNLATKSEAVALRTFDEFSDKTPIEKAHEALERLGGTAEKTLISSPMLEKPKRNLKLPPAPN